MMERIDGLRATNAGCAIDTGMLHAFAGPPGLASTGMAPFARGAPNAQIAALDQSRRARDAA